MEIVIETNLVPQPPKEVKAYFVGDQSFTSYIYAEKYVRQLLAERFFKDIPHQHHIIAGENQHWYYCESLNHLRAVIGKAHYLSIAENYKDIAFPQWIFLVDDDSEDGYSAKVVTLDEVKKWVRETTNLINNLERGVTDG